MNYPQDPELAAGMANQLNQIAQSLLQQLKGKKHALGMTCGYGGISLFFLQYYLYTHEGKYLEAAISLWRRILNRNLSKASPFFATGLSGVGWLLHYARQKGVIDMNTEQEFATLDEYLGQVMLRNAERGNYDYLNGACGIGFYFLEGKHAHFRERVTRLLEALLATAVQDDTYCRWPVYDYATGATLAGKSDMGLAHGLASLIAFFIYAARSGVGTGLLEPIIHKSTAYLLACKQSPRNANESYFPNFVVDFAEIHPKSRLGWCYGDLGIGLTLWNAGTYCRNDTYQQTALEILKNAGCRRSPAETDVKDASLCHGASGVAYLFHKMFVYSKDPFFRQVSTYWFGETLRYAANPDGAAGFRYYTGDSSNPYRPELGLLDGIAGIGLTYLGYLTGDTGWDKCLLLPQ